MKQKNGSAQNRVSIVASDHEADPDSEVLSSKRDLTKAGLLVVCYNLHDLFINISYFRHLLFVKNSPHES